MRERDRLQIREWNEEQERIAAAEREERERPIREAEAAFNANYAKLHTVLKERVVSQVDVDGRWTDPLLTGTVMPEDEAKRYNAEAFETFKRDTPDFYLSAANVSALFGYLERNGINIATAETYRRAHMRLAEFGLLESAPEPEPEPEIEPEPIAPPPPETFEGIDLETGEPRIYTAYEVDRMSSDKFVRVFRIPKFDGMARPPRSL